MSGHAVRHVVDVLPQGDRGGEGGEEEEQRT